MTELQMAECTQGKRTEYCMKTENLNQLEAPKAEGPASDSTYLHPIFGGAISNPVMILQNYKETVFGLTVECELIC